MYARSRTDHKYEYHGYFFWKREVDNVKYDLLYDKWFNMKYSLRSIGHVYYKSIKSYEKAFRLQKNVWD